MAKDLTLADLEALRAQMPEPSPLIGYRCNRATYDALAAQCQPQSRDENDPRAPYRLISLAGFRIVPDAAWLPDGAFVPIYRESPPELPRRYSGDNTPKPEETTR